MAIHINRKNILKLQTITGDKTSPQIYFDHMERLIHKNRGEALRLLARLGKTGSGCLADVGCGPATISRIMAKEAGNNVSIDCFDVDPAMLKIAREAALRDGLDNISFHQINDDCDLPAHPTYELILSRYVLQHVENYLRHLKKLLAMLEPHGELILIDILRGGFNTRLRVGLQRLAKPFVSHATRTMFDAFYSSARHAFTLAEIRSILQNQDNIDFTLETCWIRPLWIATLTKKSNP